MPAVTVHPAWQTYADELAMLGHGLALWQPAPLHNYDKVNIGDVGYIRQGRFHLLFSAARPLGDRQLGVDVPPNFVHIEPGPTVKDQPRMPGALHTDYIEQKGASFSASSDITCIDVGTTFQFESSNKKGAILLTKYKTFCEDAERLGFFKDYMLRNYQSWVDYANQLGHMVVLEDILLITGHDMTLDFAMLAFSSNSRQIGIEFEAGLPAVASASASVWGVWRTTMSVHHNCGPQHREPPMRARPLLTNDSHASEESKHEYNQCIFLRGFRIRKRAGFIPTVIKAAAGPHDLGPGRRFDEHGPMICSDIADSDEELVAVSNTPPFIDPLDPLSRYIFENSNADLAVVHDFDLSNLLELTDTSTAEDMDKLLSRLSPQMIEVGPDETACFKSTQNVKISGPLGITVPFPSTIEALQQQVRKLEENLERLTQDRDMWMARARACDTSLAQSQTPVAQVLPRTRSAEQHLALAQKMEGPQVEPRTRIYLPDDQGENHTKRSLSPLEPIPPPVPDMPAIPVSAFPLASPSSPSFSEGPERDTPDMSLGVHTSKNQTSQSSSMMRWAGPRSAVFARRTSGSRASARPLPPRPVSSPLLQAHGHVDRFSKPETLSTSPLRRRTRPPLPIGPRKASGHCPPLQPSHNNISTSVISSHAPIKGLASTAGFTQASPEFQMRPVRWRALTMDAAKWTFTSEQLMDVLRRAIHRSSEVSSIRLLTPDVFNQELPEEIVRLETLREEIKLKYGVAATRRRVLLDKLSLYDNGSDVHMIARLSQELIGLSFACDRFAEDLFHVMDELQQINKLRDVHSTSALALVLKTLNSNLVKESFNMADLRMQVTQLEAERDEAWTTAERVERDLLDLGTKMNLLDKDCGTDIPKSTTTRPRRVAAARKAATRVSQAGLQLPHSSCHSHNGSNRMTHLGQRLACTPRLPCSQKLSLDTDLPLASIYRLYPIGMHSALTNSSDAESHPRKEAQNDMYDILGTAPAHLCHDPSCSFRSNPEPNAPHSLPTSPFASSFDTPTSLALGMIPDAGRRRSASFSHPRTHEHLSLMALDFSFSQSPLTRTTASLVHAE